MNILTPAFNLILNASNTSTSAPTTASNLTLIPLIPLIIVLAAISMIIAYCKSGGSQVFFSCLRARHNERTPLKRQEKHNDHSSFVV